jgi:hypothetical protein
VALMDAETDPITIVDGIDIGDLSQSGLGMVGFWDAMKLRKGWGQHWRCQSERIRRWRVTADDGGGGEDEVRTPIWSMMLVCRRM